jgi:serine/threonine-protein kinase
MGRVYKAHGTNGEPVALKIVKANIAQDETYRRRFEREARIATRVTHRHVVPVLESGEHRGVPYMVQRFVEGGSLQDKIDREGQLEVRIVVRVCLQTASGLEAVHEAGLVHRDLKPANILLDTAGSAFITDFGLAKQRDASVLTMPGQALGSMDYMAPEQIRGHDVSPATDVYALGCVTYECLAGKAPFADKQGMQILWAHLRDDPPDPCAERADLPEEIGWAVTRALAKEPDQRPPNATAFARLLQVAAGPASGMNEEPR